MAHIIVELRDGSGARVEFSSDPPKTAAQVLNACARRFNMEEGTLSPKDKPNFVLMAEDTVAGGVTYIFIPHASFQGTTADSAKLDELLSLLQAQREQHSVEAQLERMLL